MVLVVNPARGVGGLFATTGLILLLAWQAKAWSRALTFWNRLLRPLNARSRTPRLAMVAPSLREVGFLTDSEGNWNHLLNYVRISRVLFWVEEETHLGLRDDCGFVFGGDAFDKGAGIGGDIRLSQLLVRLKSEFPDRVFLLLGNRDLNKLRFAAELHRSDIARPLAACPALIPCEQISVLEYLQKLASRSPDLSPEALNTEINRLRYCYEETLGCADTFELRRRELAQLKQCQPEQVSERDVLDHVVASVRKGGIVHEYISHAVIAAVIGDTIFVHGRTSVDLLPY